MANNCKIWFFSGLVMILVLHWGSIQRSKLVFNWNQWKSNGTELFNRSGMYLECRLHGLGVCRRSRGRFKWHAEDNKGLKSCIFNQHFTQPPPNFSTSRLFNFSESLFEL